MEDEDFWKWWNGEGVDMENDSTSTYAIALAVFKDVEPDFEKWLAQDKDA